MSNVLLIEPAYRSKFPPLGLLRIAAYHKQIGDSVTFARGRSPQLRDMKWHRVYVSSLFTYELPRTVRTIRYYSRSVESDKDIIVGGVGATLMPDYVRNHVSCRVVVGPLTQPRLLARERRPIAKYLPDYAIIDDDRWAYRPQDSYFCRITTGCIRKCKFCAVPVLEPEFAYLQPLRQQVREISRAYGERQHLVVLDNNILASAKFEQVVDDIKRSGFEKRAKRNGRRRTVDFNQGIDARLITRRTAALLSTLPVHPVRLAFDYVAVEKAYVRAVRSLAERGFRTFTTYVMFNYEDTPSDFYHRICLNARLSQELDIRISSFPMKYTPIGDVTRRYVSPLWKWRYIRGIQCVLNATHGLVSPNLNFVQGAFGSSEREFLELLSMPDRYLMFRNKYASNGISHWRRLFRRLSAESRDEFLDALCVLNRCRDKESRIGEFRKFRRLLEHYYPNGRPTPCE